MDVTSERAEKPPAVYLYGLLVSAGWSVGWPVLAAVFKVPLKNPNLIWLTRRRRLVAFVDGLLRDLGGAQGLLANLLIHLGWLGFCHRGSLVPAIVTTHSASHARSRSRQGNLNFPFRLSIKIYRLSSSPVERRNEPGNQRQRSQRAPSPPRRNSAMEPAESRQLRK